MPLLPPTHDRFDEFCEIVNEFGGVDLAGSGFWGDRHPVLTRERYDAWVEDLLAEGDESIPAPEQWVKCSYFWIVDDASRWVGFLALRRALNDSLLEEGGHIGYSVRPSRRREGHATRALREALTEAARLGIGQALVTCDDDNAGSRGTIESCGGVLEDVRGGKRRYWLATGV